MTKGQITLLATVITLLLTRINAQTGAGCYGRLQPCPAGQVRLDAIIDPNSGAFQGGCTCGCPPALSDPQSPGYCGAPRTVNFNAASMTGNCQCTCPPDINPSTCAGRQLWHESTCACKCPEWMPAVTEADCTAPQVFLPELCECGCPQGSIYGPCTGEINGKMQFIPGSQVTDQCTCDTSGVICAQPAHIPDANGICSCPEMGAAGPSGNFFPICELPQIQDPITCDCVTTTTTAPPFGAPQTENCESVGGCQCLPGTTGTCTINCDVGNDACKDGEIRCNNRDADCIVNCISGSACAGAAQIFGPEGSGSLIVNCIGGQSCEGSVTMDASLSTKQLITDCQGSQSCKGSLSLLYGALGGKLTCTGAPDSCQGMTQGSFTLPTGIETRPMASFECVGQFCPPSAPANFNNVPVGFNPVTPVIPGTNPNPVIPGGNQPPITIPGFPPQPPIIVPGPNTPPQTPGVGIPAPPQNPGNPAIPLPPIQVPGIPGSGTPPPPPIQIPGIPGSGQPQIPNFPPMPPVQLPPQTPGSGLPQIPQPPIPGVPQPPQPPIPGVNVPLPPVNVAPQPPAPPAQTPAPILVLPPGVTPPLIPGMPPIPFIHSGGPAPAVPAPPANPVPVPQTPQTPATPQIPPPIPPQTGGQIPPPQPPVIPPQLPPQTPQLPQTPITPAIPPPQIPQIPQQPPPPVWMPPSNPGGSQSAPGTGGSTGGVLIGNNNQPIPIVRPDEEVICEGTGGECVCSGTRSCTIKCETQDACKEKIIKCPTNHDCTVLCSGDVTCNVATIEGPIGKDLTVNCAGSASCQDTKFNAAQAKDVTYTCSVKDACKGSTQINCGTGRCEVACPGEAACDSAAINTNSAVAFLCSGAPHCPPQFTAPPVPIPTIPPTAPCHGYGCTCGNALQCFSYPDPREGCHCVCPDNILQQAMLSDPKEICGSGNGGQEFNPRTCGCDCPAGVNRNCPPTQVFNQNTCQCECPGGNDCPGASVMNADTCNCECPSPRLSPQDCGALGRVLRNCQCACQEGCMGSGQIQDLRTCGCACPAGTPLATDCPSGILDELLCECAPEVKSPFCCHPRIDGMTMWNGRCFGRTSELECNSEPMQRCQWKGPTVNGIENIASDCLANPPRWPREDPARGITAGPICAFRLAPCRSDEQCCSGICLMDGTCL